MTENASFTEFLPQFRLRPDLYTRIVQTFFQKISNSARGVGFSKKIFDHFFVLTLKKLDVSEKSYLPSGNIPSI